MKRTSLLLLGVALFVLMNYAGSFPDAVDPKGQAFPLTPEGRGAVALFLLASIWWVTEVVPIGMTAIAIGVIQVLFGIRAANAAFTDFMDPSVWFIFGSLSIGMVFTKTGLTRRIAYKMLGLIGERTKMIYLGCFAMVILLTMVMAHTAVAATMFPLLLAVNGLYSEEDRPTRFGKGLFIGMAYVAGAGSIVTLLGSARAAVALGFFKDMTGKNVSFFELSYYMAPLGITMMLILWALMTVVYRPERATIAGLRERARTLYTELGPISKNEILAAVLVLTAVTILGLRSFVPAFGALDKSAVILSATLLFFVFKIVDVDDLENTPWNIVLLFGGAMSIGNCLWQTGAAKWMAVHWLSMFGGVHWFILVMGIAFLVLVLTNFIMNVAAIAITLPVALVIAGYVGVSGEVIFYSCLATAGMPFVLLVGAAPNAIAYGSRQFTAKEFAFSGALASALLIVVLGLFVTVIWPAMGMPLRTP